MSKLKQSYADYQSRSYAFQIGDSVLPIIGGSAPMWPFEGTVVAVYPAIGQVDVQLPYGSQRFSVEELIIDPNAASGGFADMLYDSVPGGAGTVRVPGGPPPEHALIEEMAISHKEARVADRYIKQSMYWHGRDRQYRATKQELEQGSYTCPRCRCHETPMTTAIYKRLEGSSTKLLTCPECSFLIKYDDVYRG